MVKRLGNLLYEYCPDIVPALPSLDILFAHDKILAFIEKIKIVPLQLFGSSIVVVKKVSRFPLKPAPSNANESEHLQTSADGLSLPEISLCLYRYFHLIGVYPENCQSQVGLIQVANIGVV